ncbi:SRPBCC family protein [Tomitella biformata]|uniref:SRPBCC family protein n=1 Tax=Tomitella biformata TaxID=630403 RepID=UPI000463D216|nr:SRPBCC family protein [Tomitella biformata]
MGLIQISAVAQVPVSVAFAFVDDHRNVPDWMFGVTKFEPIGAQDSGLGAEFDVVMQLGPKAMKSKIRCTEWGQDEVITLTSYEGMRNNSSWRFRAVDAEKTELSVDFGYEFPGGFAGKALAKIVEPAIQIAIRQTEQNLRKAIEEHHRANPQD